MYSLGAFVFIFSSLLFNVIVIAGYGIEGTEDVHANRTRIVVAEFQPRHRIRWTVASLTFAIFVFLTIVIALFVYKKNGNRVKRRCNTKQEEVEVGSDALILINRHMMCDVVVDVDAPTNAAILSKGSPLACRNGDNMSKEVKVSKPAREKDIVSTVTTKRRGSIRKNNKKRDEAKVKHRTWHQGSFDTEEMEAIQRTDISQSDTSMDSKQFRNKSLEDKLNDKSTTRESKMSVPSVIKRSSSVRRNNKARNETKKKHQTWYEGYSSNTGHDTREDETIEEMEKIIRDYVEKALNAEYYKSLIISTNEERPKQETREDVVITAKTKDDHVDESNTTVEKTERKKKRSIIRRIRNSIIRTNSNSFEEDRSNAPDDPPPPSASKSTKALKPSPSPYRKVSTGSKERTTKVRSLYSEEEEEIILDNLERRLIEQVNGETSLPLPDFLTLETLMAEG